MRKLVTIAVLSCVLPGCIPYGGSPPPSVYPSAEIEQLQICLKYKVDNQWSRGHIVDAQLMKGDMLNQKTRTRNYRGWATYVVVVWDKGEASYIELSQYAGSIPSSGVTGKDQRGRLWQVSQTSNCK